MKLQQRKFKMLILNVLLLLGQLKSGLPDSKIGNFILSDRSRSEGSSGIDIDIVHYLLNKIPRISTEEFSE